MSYFFAVETCTSLEQELLVFKAQFLPDSTQFYRLGFTGHALKPRWGGFIVAETSWHCCLHRCIVNSFSNVNSICQCAGIPDFHFQLDSWLQAMYVSVKLLCF